MIVIMRADNRGEGGIMALTALASRSTQTLTRPWWKTMTTMIGEPPPGRSWPQTIAHLPSARIESPQNRSPNRHAAHKSIPCCRSMGKQIAAQHAGQCSRPGRVTSRAEIILSWQVVSGRRTARSLGSASKGNGIWTLEQHWERIVR